MVWICLFAVIVLVASRVTYRIAFHVSPRQRGKGIPLPGGEQYAAVKHITRPLMDEMERLPFEQVFITAADGVRLAGRYYHCANGAPLQIQFHGYRGSPVRDFCGGNHLARSLGHNTLVVDQRAHGLSGSCTITFGVKERYDCLAWAQYAARRWPDAPILLSGVSMGAATVLMASGLDLPESVRGVIADCPYSAPGKIIAKVCRDMRIPPVLAMPFIRLGARIFGMFRLDAADAARAVRGAKVPILILHGEDDRFVPCAMSAEIAQANPVLVRRHTFPGAGHGLSYVTDPGRYGRLVRAFAEETIAQG